jgi:Flp pilus assembly pilin Flp
VTSASARIPESVNRSTGTRHDARHDLPVHRREVNRMQKFFARLRREEGQTMAEYGVVLAVITVAIVGVLTLLSDSIQNAIQGVIDAIS